MLELTKVFQAEINLDNMSNADIQKAILIRHGATHKHLVDEKGEEANVSYFKKVVNHTIAKSRANIGESLRNWAFAIHESGNETVRFERRSTYALPDFITQDSAVLLSTLLLEKQSNEYRLRKLFGPAFNEKYAHLVVRLIGIGILRRNVDGWLEINPAVVNDLANLLERKKYVSFTKS